jgi:type 1 glutamine amidotransferase
MPTGPSARALGQRGWFAPLIALVSLIGVAGTAPGCTAARGVDAPTPPLVVFVVGDHEYSSEATLPHIAAELERSYGMRTRVLTAYPDHTSEENIPGLEALAEADLAVFYLRWRRLPAEQVEHIDRYLRSGGPVVGFRTSTHAFNYPAGHPLERWNAFGAFALGSPPGWGRGHTHYGATSSTDVRIAPNAAGHPILTGIDDAFHVRSWLYHVLPDYPPADATPLLIGRAVNPNNPNAIDNPVAWTWRTEWGGRSFTTTLGHPEEFSVEPFQRLVINGIHWALDLPVPDWAGPIEIAVPYRH